MAKRERIFKQLKSISEAHDIKFECYLGRRYDCGEICFDYDESEGYILFSYDRACRTYYYSTKDLEELKYILFSNLCSLEGFKYEVANRKVSKCNKLRLKMLIVLNKSKCLGKYKKLLKFVAGRRNPNNLSSDTRKVAFEHTLILLCKIDRNWMMRKYPEYVKLLNMWRDEENVYFDLNDMKFKISEA